MAGKKVIRCPAGHTTTWMVGIVPNVSGPKQRYKCKTCGRSFYIGKDKPKAKRTKKS